MEDWEMRKQRKRMHQTITTLMGHAMSLATTGGGGGIFSAFFSPVDVTTTILTSPFTNAGRPTRLKLNYSHLILATESIFFLLTVSPPWPSLFWPSTLARPRLR